jgi:hypothetical protein
LPAGLEIALIAGRPFEPAQLDYLLAQLSE